MKNRKNSSAFRIPHSAFRLHTMVITCGDPCGIGPEVILKTVGRVLPFLPIKVVLKPQGVTV